MTSSVRPKAAEADPMSLMRLKLKRANERLDALQRQLGRHSKAHPVSVTTKLDFQSGWHTSYVRKAELPPARFALPVGESLYHGRSVLDHLVWALVKSNGETPGKDNEFPILPKPPSPGRGESNRDAFIRVMRMPKQKLFGVSVAAATLIESLQPYNRGNKPTYFLTVLNKMAREDRHHALHPSLVAMGDPESLSARLAVPDGVAVTDWEPLFKAGSRLKPGTKLARFRLSRYGREPKVGMEVDLPAYIAFGKPPVSLEGLREINRHLAERLGLFEEFF
jgi:hypothetical protein